MIGIVLLILVALLAVWVIRTAGWRFAFTRFAQAALILLIVTFGTTWLLRQSVVDEKVNDALVELNLPAESGPCIVALGTGADNASVLKCVDDLKLDRPVYEQYGSWLGSMFRGDLGFAQYRTQIPLSKVLGDRAPRSLLLFLYSQLIALGLSVPAGVWAAYQAGKPGRRFPPTWLLPLVIVGAGVLGFLAGWSGVAIAILAVLVPIYLFFGYKGGAGGDGLVNTSAFVLLSIPAFVIGESLRYFFAIRSDVYDLVGYISPTEGLWDHARSMWLPSLVLGLALSPVYLRLLRSDMIANLQQDFTAVAKAKGLPNWWVLFRHVLRPSTLTLLTVAGLNIAQLVNGAIITEFIFDLDGVGSYFLEAVAAKEFFPLQTLVAIVAILFVGTNTIVDIFYSAVDPRVRADDEK